SDSAIRLESRSCAWQKSRASARECTTIRENLEKIRFMIRLTERLPVTRYRLDTLNPVTAILVLLAVSERIARRATPNEEKYSCAITRSNRLMSDVKRSA